MICSYYELLLIVMFMYVIVIAWLKKKKLYVVFESGRHNRKKMFKFIRCSSFMAYVFIIYPLQNDRISYLKVKRAR